MSLFLFGCKFMLANLLIYSLLYRFIHDRKEELSPLEILKVRLAKGEISLEEFEQLLKKCE
ncbi:SHOCT domain-containing protein [Geobacillus sp. TFV-3]|uniref:SHOCT domain-containing protein n=1 Tax=Geobacillus sp. TFV-3 TaxID=1897059 RepID=UPI001916FC3F|nr:hypothetical protein BJQ97_02614 [Geobacillus sp. TFV-3]